MAAHVLTAEDLEPLRRELAELRALLGARAVGDVLSTDQAAELANVTAKTVRAWVQAGALPARRRGRRIAILRADLDAYLAGTPPAAAALLSSLTSPPR
jgi:excisionase family DNA binding protein